MEYHLVSSAILSALQRARSINSPARRYLLFVLLLSIAFQLFTFACNVSTSFNEYFFFFWIIYESIDRRETDWRETVRLVSPSRITDRDRKVWGGARWFSLRVRDKCVSCSLTPYPDVPRKSFVAHLSWPFHAVVLLSLPGTSPLIRMELQDQKYNVRENLILRIIFIRIISRLNSKTIISRVLTIAKHTRETFSNEIANNIGMLKTRGAKAKVRRSSIERSRRTRDGQSGRPICYIGRQ